LAVDSGNPKDTFWTVLAIGRATEITDPAQIGECRRLGLADLTGTPAEHFLRLQPDILAGYRATAARRSGEQLHEQPSD
jgi:hypothetical protein